ncbi:MAG: hypothetical protein P1U85_19975 [Verrucomicrobiales bacterium]|nr:hypothetical protein [Verrucomicrobiales bacterium]
MGFFFIAIISSLAGWIGWWIGDFFGIAVAIFLSMIFSVIGLHYGAKWNREYFS